MEQLTWGGPTGIFLYPAFMTTLIVLGAAVLCMLGQGFVNSDSVTPANRKSRTTAGLIVGAVFLGVSYFLFGGTAIMALFAVILGVCGVVAVIYSAVTAIAGQTGIATAGGITTAPGTTFDLDAFILRMVSTAAIAFALVLVLWVLGMILFDGENRGIIGIAVLQFTPVWIGMIVVFAVSILTKARTGLYGRLFDSPIGMIGFALVLFWVLTAIFADQIALFDPLAQVSGMKNKKPGWPLSGAEGQYYILGGDNLARDVFSRLVHGSRTVMKIAPTATLFAFMVGITLGLPAGYFSGRLDTFLSFLANLVLAFPVILLFYLLVTPEIRSTGIPIYLAALLFLFPIIFFVVLVQTKLYTQPGKMWTWLAIILVLGFWAYSGLAFNSDPFGVFSMDPNLLNIFVSVVFVNSPTVFRIVRGLTMDIKTRDYVAAAQTRGEGPWYIMLWEILPNARGPLIVDFCLRIGYTTILLGTLGFFGLGVSPESPDWGMTINEGRKLLSIHPHPALPPALALMSLVLGLNLLADGLREQSLKD